MREREMSVQAGDDQRGVLLGYAVSDRLRAFFRAVLESAQLRDPQRMGEAYSRLDDSEQRSVLDAFLRLAYDSSLGELAERHRSGDSPPKVACSVVIINLNPAIELAFSLGVPLVFRRIFSGGKGGNVASVLLNSGFSPRRIVGFYSGETGDLASALLTSSGACDVTDVCPLSTDARYFVHWEGSPLADSIVSAGGAVSGASEEELTRLIVDRVAECAARSNTADYTCVVIAGGVPRGLNADIYGKIIALLRETERTRIILDTRDDFLVHGIRGKPWMVKVNRQEFESVLRGYGLRDSAGTAEDRPEIVFDLAFPEIRYVVVTQGRRPAVVFDAEARTATSILPPSTQVRDTIGSGDSVTAALALLAQHEHFSPRQALKAGVAVGTLSASLPGGHLASTVDSIRAFPDFFDRTTRSTLQSVSD